MLGKNKKAIYILLIVVFLLISLNAVNSADVDNNTIVLINNTDLDNSSVIDDNSLYEDNVSNTNTTSDSHSHASLSGFDESPIKASVITAPGGTFVNFKTIINSAAQGDTISITGDYYYNYGSSDTKAGIVINKKNLIILGNGHTFDGKGVSRIFNVTAAGVSIYNLTFYNGTTSTKTGSDAPHGGGILAYGKILVDSCTFKFNTGQLGSAFAQIGGIGTYINCTLVNNTALGDLSEGRCAIIHSSTACGGMNLKNTLFVDNSGVNIITFSQKKDNFTNNVFYNNVARTAILHRLGSGSNTNYNWWGTNIPKFDKLRDDGAVAQTWVITNFTNVTPVSLSPSGGSIDLRVFLNAVFNHTSKSYQSLIGGIAPRRVYYSANVGSFNVTSEEFNGVSNVKFTYPAGATNITITAKVDNQVLFVRIPDTIGTFTELQALIDSTPSGGTISLTKDYYYDSRYDLPLTHGMTINKPINIIGNGHTISGFGDARIFQITGSYVNLTNISFIDGYAVSTLGGSYVGAAIYCTGSYLNVLQCNFENNSANSSSTNGGVIYCSGTGSSFSYSSFANNYGKVYVSSNNINYNWWGSNSPTWSSIFTSSSYYPTYYAIMNFTNLNPITVAGGTVDLRTYLNTYTNRANTLFGTLSKDIFSRRVTYTTTSGSLAKSNADFVNRDNNSLTYSSGLSSLQVKATIDGQTLVIGTSDVSVDISVNDDLPVLIEIINYTITVRNNGPDFARSLTVDFKIPSGFLYVSDSGGGNYSYTSGKWHISNLTSGQSRVLKVSVRVPYNSNLLNKTFWTPVNVSGAYADFVNSNDNATINITVVPKDGGSYLDLQYLMDSTPAGGTLKLLFNITYDPVHDASLISGMNISKALTLDGDGFNISGIGTARIFRVLSSNVVLKNINFMYGKASTTNAPPGSYNGGAIFMGTSSAYNLTIINCSFFNNTASSMGGAIYNYAGTLLVLNSSFLNNSAKNYGAICSNYSTSNLNVTGSLFEGNKASGTYSTLYIYNGNANYNAFVGGSPFRSVHKVNGDLEANWWGNNTPVLASLITGTAPTTIILMNFSNITPISYGSGSSILKVNLDTVYNISDGSLSTGLMSLPARTVVYEWTNGTVSPGVSSFIGSTTSTFSYPASMDVWTVNATIDNQTLWIGSSDLAIIIIPSSNPATDGDNITFTVQVINNGPIDAFDVNVTLNLPSFGLVNITIINNTGVWDNTTSTWYIGRLNSTKVVTLLVNGTLADPGEYLVWNASIINTTGYYDNNFTNNTYVLNLTINQIADLWVTKVLVNSTSPQVKSNITYMIVVENLGPSTARNITVLDVLPSNLIFLNYTSTWGVYDNDIGVWYLDNLTPGSNETLNITVFINKSGFTNNFVNVSSIINDTNLTNNVDNISFISPALSDIWVTIGIMPQTSNYITYHIQAGNNGIEGSNGTIVQVNLSSLCFYYNSTVDKGVYNNLTGVWDIGYLDVGEVVNMTLIVRLDFPIGVYFANVTTGVNITSWSTDLYLPNNTDNVTVVLELFGNFRLLQDYVNGWAENTTQVLPRSFAYDPVLDAWQDGETYDLVDGVRLYKNVTIVNPYGFKLSGFNMARIFNISADNIVLDSLLFFDGGESPVGGALNIHADNVQVLRSNFTKNWIYGDYGGAIYTNGENTVIRDNIFIENSGSKLGGAIGANNARNLTVLNNTFINNTVKSDKITGGAVGFINSTGTVNYNVFLDNRALAYDKGHTMYIENSPMNFEYNWFGNNTPDMVSDELIWGVKPDTYVVLDWEFVNPNMTGVELNVVFLSYNISSGEKTPLANGLPYRYLNVTSRNPTLSWYNTTYVGNNSVNYTYNVAIPVYQINATVDYETLVLEFSTLLNLYKVLANDTIWFGDNLIYNITIVNYGPHNTLVINVTDLMPSGLTINSISSTIGSKSQIGDDIYWTLTVPAGVNATLIINATPTVEGEYINNVSLNRSTELDYFINGTNKTVTANVLRLSDLEVNLTITSPHFYVGEDIVYHLRVANYGPSVAYNITVNMPVDSGLIYLYQDWPGTYNQTTGLWNISSLNPGDIIDINITFRINKSGWYNQTVNITSDSIDNITWNNNKTLSFNVTKQVDLVLNMSINKGEALLTDNSIYITFNLTNLGPSPADNVTVFIYFNGLDFITKTSGFGSFVNDTPTAGRWLVGNLDANTTRTMTLRFAANTLGNFTITGRANSSDNDSKWSDNYANVTIKVIKYADLSIIKTVSNTTPYVGQIINYTITVKNLAGFDVENVTVIDILDSRLIYDNNNPLYNGTHWFVGNLTVGESKNITFNVTVNGTGTIWNNVTVNGSLNDSNLGNNHYEISILSEYKNADLRITKTVNNTNPFLEENITYTITVTNLAGFDTENVTVYDPLPIVLVYDGNNPDFNGTHWFVGNLSVGESKNISFIVTVDGIGRIWNNATVNSSLYDKNPNNNNASVAIDVPSADDLRIYLSVIPNPPQANTPFIINVTVWNRGFEDNNNVTVDFVIPASLSYINSTGMGSYNPGTGVWDIGYLANGSRVSLEIWVYPNVVGNVTITANVSGGVPDVAPWNNRANLTFEIVPAYDLTITKTASNYTIYDGDTISFDITVWNNGPYPANTVKITDYLPNGVKYLFDNSSGVYYTGNNTVEWNIPTLNMGDNITIHLIAKVWNPGFSFDNRVVVSAYGTDNNITDNTAYSGVINVTQVSDLEVILNASKTEDIDMYEVITFYVTVINHGPSNASGVIADFLLPTGLTYTGDNSSGFYNPSNGTWYVGVIGSGENITLMITVNLTGPGIYALNSTVNGSYYDNDTSNNIAFLNISSTNIFDLNITAYWNMTDNTIVWGDTGEYTVIISNKGPDNATNVTVSLYIPGMNYLNHTGPGTLNTTTMVWNVGNLTVGEYKNITIRFNATNVGFYLTTGNITGHGYDNNTLDNNYTLNLTVLPLVDLVMTNITVNTTFTGYDSLLEFNVTVYNRGPCNATNTTIVGLLPTGWSIVGGTTTGNIPVNKTEVFTIIVNATTCGTFNVGFNATINGRDTYPLDNWMYLNNITVVYAADLMITIKVSNEYPLAGDIITYIVTVTNLDWHTAHNVKADVRIPGNLTYHHFYSASGSYNPSNGTWDIGNLSYRNSTNLFLFVRVTTPGTTWFDVNVSGDDYDFNLTNNNDTVNISTTPGCDLNITMIVDNSTPGTGDNITFTVFVENIGAINATGVNVNINIPTGFINPRSTDLNFTGNSYYIGKLATGDIYSFNFTVTPIVSGVNYVTATVTSNLFDYNTGNNLANLTITPYNASDLVVSITSDKNLILVGENITYTITVYNNGYVDVNNVLIYNNLPYSLNYVSSVPLYVPSSGLWQINNISAGASETLNITITHSSIGVFNFTANASGMYIDTNTSNNIDNITINVVDYNDLITIFTVEDNSVLIGDILNFTITVYNNGSFNNTSVMVYTDLPDTGYYNTTQGVFDTKLGIWNIGNLSAGENATINILINASNIGTYTFWANSTGKQFDKNLSNNNKSLSINISADYDIGVNITVINNTNIMVGDNLTFIITAWNNGPTIAHNITVNTNLPGVLNKISQGTYTTGVWNIGDLNPSNNATINLTLTPISNGTFTYTVNISANNMEYDSNNTNNNDTINIHIINGVDLVITLQSNTTTIFSGEDTLITVTIFNNGSSTANNVLVNLTSLLNGTYTTNYTTGLLSMGYWFIPTITGYQNITLNITRKIYSNTNFNANVTSNDIELNNNSNKANLTITVKGVVDLSVNITVNQTISYLTDNVTFTITVYNNGIFNASNVTVYTNLPYTLNYTNTEFYDSLNGIWYIGTLENNTKREINITVSLNKTGTHNFNATVNTTTIDNNTSNNKDNVSIYVDNLINLQINITANQSSFKIGDTVLFTILVKNNGPSNASMVNVTYTLPGTPDTPSQGLILYTGFWSIGTLNATENATLNITTLITTTTDGIYTFNTTGVEYEHQLSDNNFTLNITHDVISDLSVTITSNTSTLNATDLIRYTITATNYGSDPVNNPIVNIQLPDNFIITSSMLSNGIFNGTTWNISSLGVGGLGIANLIIDGYYNTTSQGEYTTHVNITSNNTDNNTNNNKANNTITIDSTSDLIIQIINSPFFNPDGTMTFNITVTNLGNINVTNVTIYTNLKTSNYTLDKGYFDNLQGTWYIGDLNKLETRTFILNSFLGNESYFYANITNSSKTDKNTSNNFDYVNITQTRLADLEVKMQINNTNPYIGDTILVTITVINHGPYNADNVITYTNLPASTTYTLTKGLFDTVNGNWSIGTLNPNETATLNITINITSLGEYTYTSNITSSTNDTNTTNNNATIKYNVSAYTDLGVNITVNQTIFTVGDNITFTINLTNYSPINATNILINITLPDNFINDPITPTNGTINNNTWNITTLNNNTSIQLNITGILTNNGTSTITTNILDNTKDNNTLNNKDTLTIYVNNIYDLSITINSNATSILAGDLILLTINLTNHGPGNTENITINTNIINATSLKTDGYYDKDTGTWYLTNITSNTTTLLYLTIRVTENTTYNVNITNTDTNTSNNNDTVNITVGALAQLIVNATVSNTHPYIGEEITYTITIQNIGYSTAENVNLTITNLVGNFNFTYCNCTNYDNTTGIWTIGNITPFTTKTLILKYLVNSTNFTITTPGIFASVITSNNVTNTFLVNSTTYEQNITGNQINITICPINTTKPINVTLVDLIINITANNTTPTTGELISFNITVFNNGTNTATNLTIINTLPTGLTPILPYTGTWATTNLAPMGTISFTFTANTTNMGSFVDNVTVDCNEWDGNPVNNRANILIINNPPGTGNYTDIIINYTRTENLTIDDLITYNITITNQGLETAYNTTAIIAIFSDLNIITYNDTNYNTTTNEWNIGNLTPGNSKTITITANITKAGIYTNIFLALFDGLDSKPQNNMEIDTFTINDTRINIELKITANTTYAKNNDHIKFTIYITNPTPNDAHNVTLTLHSPPELILPYIPGYNTTTNTYYIGTLNNNTEYTLSFTAQINNTLANDITIAGNITLNETDYYPNNNYDNLTITIINNLLDGVADLTVNLTSSLLNLTTSNMELNQYPEYGDVPYFTIHVTNHGPNNATNVKVPLTVPNGCSIMAQDAYWDNTTESFIVTQLDVNQTIKLEVSMLIETTDVLLINTTATCDQFDPNITDNTATISMYPFIPEPKCNLNVTVQAIGNEFHANSTITINITIQNNGQDIAYNVKVRNTIPTGLTLHNITTYDTYTLNSDGWDIPQILPGASMQFLATYNITKKGLYQTTVNVNSTIQDIDPTLNGNGVAFYAGEAEPPRKEVKTKVATPSVTLSGGKVKLNGGSWTFTGKLQLANNTASPSSYSNFQGQTLYANVTGPDAITRTYTADTVTGADGKTTFTVPNSDILAGENKYTILIWYKGEKTDGEHYLPSSNSKTNIKVVA